MAAAWITKTPAKFCRRKSFLCLSLQQLQWTANHETYLQPWNIFLLIRQDHTAQNIFLPHVQPVGHSWGPTSYRRTFSTVSPSRENIQAAKTHLPPWTDGIWPSLSYNVVWTARSRQAGKRNPKMPFQRRWRLEVFKFDSALSPAKLVCPVFPTP